MTDDSDHILSELSDSAFDLPALEFEDDDIDLDEALVPALTKKKRDILIEVNESCKKVVTLNDDQQDLKILFRIAVHKDPALRNYSQQPVTFQIFSEKFNTWIDLDHNDIPNLSDGTHLKAIFCQKDKSTEHARHRRKYRKRDSSPHDRKKKRKKYSKRHKHSSDDERHSYKISKASYSSDEGRKRSSSHDKKKKREKSYSKRHRASSDDESEIHSSKISRTSYSSDDGRKRSSSPRDHKKKKKKREKLYSKRYRDLSDDESEIHSSKRSRTSYSSDEGRALVTTTVIDESNNTAPRSLNRLYNASKNYCSKQYNLCSVSSTTLTVSSTNYVVSSTNYNMPTKQETSEADNGTEGDIEEGEMRDGETTSSEIVPASEGQLYRLTLGLQGKNPISALHELCAKLRCAPPVFEVIQDGYMPDQQFLMQVTFQGKSYIPNTYATKKKEAKKFAAEYCLRRLGIYE